MVLKIHSYFEIFNNNVYSLIIYIKANVDLKDSTGTTALIKAAALGRKEMV